MMGGIVVIWREFLGKIRDFKGCFPMQSVSFICSQNNSFGYVCSNAFETGYVACLLLLL